MVRVPVDEAPFALDGKGTDVNEVPRRGVIPLPKHNRKCLEYLVLSNLSTIFIKSRELILK